MVKKAIIPIAGLGTRFLPLSKIVPKEFFPLADKPVIWHIVKEALDSQIKELIFVNSKNKKNIFDYFKPDKKLIALLQKRGKKNLLKEMKELEKIARTVKFSQVIQKEPLGDGDAVLQARFLAKKEPCLVLFGDDVVDSKIPCSLQLIKIFNRYQKPVIALHKMPKEKLSSYGIVEVEKIGRRLYLIKDIKEKPSVSQAPSDLAIVGKYVINSDVFNLLKNTPSRAKGEKRLAGAFNEMIKRGMPLYGYEFEGKWLECGDKLAYLKSSLYFSLKDPRFKKELRKFLKEL